MRKKAPRVKWEKAAADDDYDAARRYLSLLFTDREASAIVGELRAAPVGAFPAKDILRASQTHLLEKDNPQVHKGLKAVAKGKALSPVLLVRGDAALGATLTIADGYHRICASWHTDEKAPIACCLADLPPRLKKGGK